MTIIEAKNLKKEFKVGFKMKKVLAIDNLSFQVEKGEIFGFLGPNGAGKSTTIKILTGLIYPTSGNAFLLGKSIFDVDTRNKIGFLPENPYFYDYLKGWEFLDFYYQLFGIKNSNRKEVIERLLKQVGLKDVEQLQLRKFSKGMLQRIGIAQALINDPELVILDEPMSGLDPIGRRDVRELILSLKEAGKTVFFSTHILADVEMICDRVAILNKGKLKAIGKLDELLSPKVKSIEIRIENIDSEGREKLEKMADKVIEQGQALFVITKDENLVEKIAELAISKKAKLVSITPHKETLEDLFFKEMTG